LTVRRPSGARLSQKEHKASQPAETSRPQVQEMQLREGSITLSPETNVFVKKAPTPGKSINRVEIVRLFLGNCLLNDGQNLRQKSDKVI
jgi:hypothetical protein